MKICKVCSFAKDDFCFEKSRRVCKDCKSIRQKHAYRNKMVPRKSFLTKDEKRKKTTIRKNKFFQIEENKIKRSLYLKEYNQRDYVKKRNAKQSKKYRKENSEKVAKINKKSYDKNKSKYAPKKREYEKQKIKNDPLFRLRKSVSGSVYHMLRNNKKSSILKYLPYTIQDLKEHIEKQFASWMTWHNWGVFNPKIWDDHNPATWTWQIDHIIPQVNLIYASMVDDNFQKCWALENLRPYSAKLNVSERHIR